MFLDLWVVVKTAWVGVKWLSGGWGRPPPTSVGRTLFMSTGVDVYTHTCIGLSDFCVHTLYIYVHVQCAICTMYSHTHCDRLCQPRSSMWMLMTQRLWYMSAMWRLNGGRNSTRTLSLTWSATEGMVTMRWMNQCSHRCVYAVVCMYMYMYLTQINNYLGYFS